MKRTIRNLSMMVYVMYPKANPKVATRQCSYNGSAKGISAENAASPASLAVEFTVEIHSIPHSNSPLITDENMFYGVC